MLQYCPWSSSNYSQYRYAKPLAEVTDHIPYIWIVWRIIRILKPRRLKELHMPISLLSLIATLDLSKAFDTLNQIRLIDLNETHNSANYLQCRQKFINFRGARSKYCKTKQDVPQWKTLSSLLFGDAISWWVKITYLGKPRYCQSKHTNCAILIKKPPNVDEHNNEHKLGFLDQQPDFGFAVSQNSPLNDRLCIIILIGKFTNIICDHFPHGSARRKLERHVLQDAGQRVRLFASIWSRTMWVLVENILKNSVPR